MSRGGRRQPSRQNGIAVITAMLVVAIATVLAVELAWETNLDLQRTEGMLTWDQAHQVGYGAEAVGARLLQDVLQGKNGAATVYSRSDDEQLCRGLVFPVDLAEGQTGGLVGGVCDLQGRFNLNNLVFNGKRDELAVKQFRRLILAVDALNEDIEIPSNIVDIIVDSTVDWIDADTSADYNGAEDDAYTSMTPPYRAANFWFTSVSEFRAVREVSADIFAALAPFLAALPVTDGQRTLLNVNTASIPVLMSLGDDVDASNAETWVADSTKTPFEDATPFAGFVDQAMVPYLGFSSAYFELRGMVTIGTTRLGMYSLLESTGQAIVPRLRQFDVVEIAAPSEDEDMEETDKEAEAEKAVKAKKDE